MNDRSGRMLDQALAQLPMEIEPAHDLWPGIERAITGRRASVEPSSERWLPLAAVASLVAVVAAGLSMQPEPSVKLRFTEPAASSGTVLPVSYGNSHNVGPSFIQARQELMVRLEAGLSGLDGATRSIVVRDLAEVRRSQVAINDALERDPNNTHLQRLLANSYRRELELLRDITQLLENAPGRTDL